VVYGSMPAKAVLYNRLAERLFSFGTGSYNSVVWAPHGRFVCLGGFGNLAGTMGFWDASLRIPLGTATARCAIYRSFSPCSRFFLTAVTFPALRVDNELALWRYDGTLLYREQGIPQLFQAEWLPSNTSSWQDRSASPAVLERAMASKRDTTPSQQSHPAPEPFRRASFGLHNRAEEARDESEEAQDKEGKLAQCNSYGGVFGQTNQPALSKSQLKRRRRKGKGKGGPGDEVAQAGAH